MIDRGGAPPDFEIQARRAPRNSVVGHIPHASTRIPAAIRAGMNLDDADLELELVRVTDWLVDDLFGWLPGLGATMFVNRLSRLVFDPERFASDEDEPMAGVGQGAIYTHTTQGRLLQAIDADERARRIRDLFDPYHVALTGLVHDTLATFGRCLILDCHSFATIPLPSESDQSPDRPDICIGTDAFHTPPALASALERAFLAEGLRVRTNSPFAGSLVPFAYYGRESAVGSVMIEVRRGLYCYEGTGRPLAAFRAVSVALERAVSSACADWLSVPS